MTTLKDIAERAGVSVTTVSLVLNNKEGRYSESVRDTILQIAKEMKYVPNYSAKQLVTQRSNAIGIVVPDLNNYFFSSLVSGIQDHLRNTNYFLLIATSNDDVEEDMKAIDLLVSRGIDLLLIAPSNNANNHAPTYIKKLMDLPLPAIMIDRIVEDFKGPQIQFNDYEGMANLTNFVLKQNHTNIAFINGDRSMARTAGRLQGFMNTMNTDSTESIFQGDYSFKSGYQLFDTIYDSKQYTAIIAANDMMAYGLLKRASERSIRIPESLSICGYDNIMFSEMLTPTLTTVNQNVELLVTETIDLMYKVLDDPSYTATIILDTELVIRDSIKEIENHSR